MKPGKMTHEEQIAIINEAVMHPDAAIQFISCDTDVVGWQDTDDRMRGFWNFQSLRYRLKPPEAPRKPWTQKDVAPNAVYRSQKYPDVWVRVVQYLPSQIEFPHALHLTYEELMVNWQYSMNNGRTWQGCWETPGAM